MNPARKSDYTVKHLECASRFITQDDLKGKLSETFDFPAERFGYIEPGHGLKGKSRWLTSDDDLEEMYQIHKSRRDILLCCQSSVDSQRTRKRSTPDDGHESQPSKPKRESCAKNVQEVEAIMEDLRKKHGSTYSTEKLSAWAHLIQMQKHSSYDCPPNLPYFKLPKSKNKKAGETTACEEQTEDHQTSTSTTISPTITTISPTKRVGLGTVTGKRLNTLQH